MSPDVEFKEGEKEHFVEIEVLYDGQREMREAFTVHMKPDDNMVAEIQVTQRATRHSYADQQTGSLQSMMCARRALQNLHT